MEAKLNFWLQTCVLNLSYTTRNLPSKFFMLKLVFVSKRAAYRNLQEQHSFSRRIKFLGSIAGIHKPVCLTFISCYITHAQRIGASFNNFIYHNSLYDNFKKLFKFVSTMKLFLLSVSFVHLDVNACTNIYNNIICDYRLTYVVCDIFLNPLIRCLHFNWNGVCQSFG